MISTRYGPYQSSVTILGFYLPSAIVICLLIGEQKIINKQNLLWLIFIDKNIQTLLRPLHPEVFCLFWLWLCVLLLQGLLSSRYDDIFSLKSSQTSRYDQILTPSATIKVILFISSQLLIYFHMPCYGNIIIVFKTLYQWWNRNDFQSISEQSQEEMVLAFLFVPYLAGYLILHLNIQVASHYGAFNIDTFLKQGAVHKWRHHFLPVSTVL